MSATADSAFASVGLDPLEVARGAIATASYVAIDISREVHNSSLLAHFDRAGVAGAEALRTLSFLREVESLDGGYWIPAPTRAVRLTGGTSLVIGTQPTDELRRHFPSIRRAGMGRIADSAETSFLPTQARASWQGVDGLNAGAWAKSVIDSARDGFALSIAEDGLEVFGTKPRRGATDEWDSAWGPADDDNASRWHGVSLFRTRTTQSKHRYFLGRCERASAFFEGPPIYNLSRMQFGLAALQGHPLRPLLTLADGIASIRLPLSPPTALRRLLVALCTEDQGSYGRRWSCDISACVPTLRDALEELSGEVQSE